MDLIEEELGVKSSSSSSHNRVGSNGSISPTKRNQQQRLNHSNSQPIIDTILKPSPSSIPTNTLSTTTTTRRRGSIQSTTLSNSGSPPKHSRFISR